MTAIQDELDCIQKELSLRDDDLNVSSEEDDKLTTSFQVSLGSEMSLKKSQASSRFKRPADPALSEKNARIKQLEQLVSTQASQIDQLKAQIHNQSYFEKSTQERTLNNAKLRQREKELTE